MQGACLLKQRPTDSCITDTGGGCNCKQRIRRQHPVPRLRRQARKQRGVASAGRRPTCGRQYSQ
eukprot:13467321-Alexandrium_andersonii.AAC.1